MTVDSRFIYIEMRGKSKGGKPKGTKVLWGTKINIPDMKICGPSKYFTRKTGHRIQVSTEVSSSSQKKYEKKL